MAQSITISGLLKQRIKLFQDAEAARNLICELDKDIKALDRVLKSLGHEIDPAMHLPRRAKNKMFAGGELIRACSAILRECEEPVTTRFIAEAIIDESGELNMSRQRMNEYAKRVARSLSRLVSKGRVTKGEDQDGVFVWSMPTAEGRGG